MKDTMCCGFRVSATPARISSISTEYYFGNEAATVTLFRLGSDERAYLTPDEARQLAAILTGAADAAEAKS